MNGLFPKVALFTLAILAPIIAGCSASDDSRTGLVDPNANNTTTKSWKLHPAAVVLEDAEVNDVTVLADRLVFPTASHAAFLAKLEPGKTILMGKPNGADLAKNGGFMERVLSVNVVGENTELMTESMAVTDVIRGHLGISKEKPVFTYIKQQANKGLKFEGSNNADAGTLYFTQGIDFDIPTGGGVVGKFHVENQLKLAPKVVFDLDIDWDVDWGWTGPDLSVWVNHAEAGAGLEYELQSEFDASIGVDFNLPLVDKELSPMITIAAGTIGPVPFTVQSGVVLSCGANFGAGVTLHTSKSMRVYGTPMMGVQYTSDHGHDGHWDGIPSDPFNYDAPTFDVGRPSTFKPVFGGTVPTHTIPMKAYAKAQCSVQARLELVVGKEFSILGHNFDTDAKAWAGFGPQASVSGGVCFDYDPVSGKFSNDRWGAALDLGVGLHVGAEAKFLGKQIGPSADLTVFNLRIANPQFGDTTCVP